MPFVVTHDASEFANRVTHRNLPVEMRSFQVRSNAKTAMPFDHEVPPDYDMTLLSEISAPVVDGVTLRATDVKMGKDVAVVSYNLEGDKYLGALVSVDLIFPESAHIETQAIFETSDINGVAISGSDVYFVGASSDNPHSPAFLNRAKLVDLHLIFPGDAPIPLGSYAGTSVAADENNIYATSGSEGGLSIINANSFSLSKQISIHDARSVAIRHGKRSLAVLSGTPGSLYRFSLKGDLRLKTDLGGASTPESKSTVVSADDLLVVALGEAGTDILCARDGVKLFHIDPVVVDDLPSENTVTNSVAVFENTLFTANGEAGVFSYKLDRTSFSNSFSYSRCGTVKAWPSGSLTLGGAGFSANHVVANNGLLLTADGVGGLKIISLKQK